MSPVSATALETCFDRIQRLNPKVNALIDVHMRPGDLPENVRANPKGKLHGVPIAIKDNICVKDWEITCSSKILKGYIAPYHATVIQKILAEGGYLLARANMDEFAFGSSCETSCYGPTRNPWNLEYAPGGSSGGSAACVASGMAQIALGSDTGGSIRQPAAFCGIVGLKPTYGRVSRYGLIAFGSSLDQIGPLSRNVKDAALMLSVIAGYDPKDSTSANVPVPDYTKITGGVKGLRVGVPKEFFSGAIDAEVESAVRTSIEILAKQGAEIVDVTLPHTQYAVPVYYVIAPSEASSNLARFDGVRYGARSKEPKSLLELYQETRELGFGEEAKRRIMLGTYALSSGYYDAFYRKAMQVRRKMVDEFQEVFKKVDVLATPTSPSAPFKLGERLEDPIQMYLSDTFTISANLVGIPALSMPCGLSKQRLPIGLQFMGKAFDEATLFRVASLIEEKQDTQRLVPELLK